ncbi:hypothetical protein V3C99_013984, partial [Haemonchus contortus]
FLGSLMIAPYFTMVLLNLAIALHRLLYTAYPSTASNLMKQTVAKAITLIIGIIFILIVVMFNTELVGMRWVDSLMSWASMTSRNYLLVRVLNKTSNYAIGVVNFLIYAVLLLILAKRKILSLKRNREIRMTIQVLCMAVCEMLFFLYWELWNMTGHGVWDLVVAETSSLLFYDVLVLPYLILNGQIHAELRRLIDQFDS